MRVQLSDVAGADAGRADVCVIGSGFAGATVAHDLARRGRSVVLLEAGGADWSDAAQALYAGQVVGDPYFDLSTCRLRQLGGTSGHWGGWCRPLDAADFDAKPGYPHAAWPIAKADLDPYAARAGEILGTALPPLDETLDPDLGITRFRMAFSRPAVRIWDTLGRDLDAAPDVRVATRANVTRLRTDGTRVTGVDVAGPDGARHVVRAETYVLATGGIENSRLMLWSDAVQNGALCGGLPVGRYWMEHPHQTLGAGLLSIWCGELKPWAEDHFFALTPDRMRALSVRNCGLRLESLGAEETTALRADLACVAPALGARMAAGLADGTCCGVRLRAAWEQAPVAANRVALSETETDRLGLPRVVLHWRQSAEDVRTARDSALAFADWLAARDRGRVRLDDWLRDLDTPVGGELAGKHHMGGTRMAATPAAGVVDRDCRVFGQQNLYLAGSSVFPSAGHANPTVTIVQLALRLADHLASV